MENVTPLDATLSQSNKPPDDNPPPDCPALVEQLAEYADDLDVLARCVVLLVGEMPRLGKPDAERALRRVGRMAERVANVATTAALHAQAAVEMVRAERKHNGDSNGGDGNGGSNGERQT